MPRTITPAMLTSLQSEEAEIVYLVEIVTKEGQALRFTDFDEVVTWMGNDYEPRGLDADSLEHTENLESVTMNLEFDNTDGDASFSALVANSDPSGWTGKIWLADPNLLGPNDPALLYEGRLVLNELDARSCTFQLAGITSVMASENRPARTFSDICEFQFGDVDTCGANRGQVVNQAVGNVSYLGATMVIEGSLAYPRTEPTASGDPGSFWQDGFITMVSGLAAGQTAKVRRSDPTTPATKGSLILDTPINPAPLVGDLYDLVKGCNRTFIVCEKRHANDAFFGGFANLPGRSGQGGF